MVEPNIERIRPKGSVGQLPEKPSISETPAFRANALRNKPNELLVLPTPPHPGTTPHTRVFATSGPKAPHEFAISPAPQKPVRHR